MISPAFSSQQIASIFDKQNDDVKKRMLHIRSLIFASAADTPLIDQIEETLKWQEPSYINGLRSKGTTLRLSPLTGSGNQLGLFVHCQTNLIAQFREAYPELTYRGNRCLVLEVEAPPADAVIKHFIYRALTYHHNKRLGIGM